MPKLKAPKLTFDQAIVMLPQVFQPVERASYHRLDLFLYGIEFTEQFYILWPHIGYAIDDSKQYICENAKSFLPRSFMEAPM